jgi:hypothetical protein
MVILPSDVPKTQPPLFSLGVWGNPDCRLEIRAIFLLKMDENCPKVDMEDKKLPSSSNIVQYTLKWIPSGNLT